MVNVYENIIFSQIEHAGLRTMAGQTHIIVTIIADIAIVILATVNK